MAEIAQSSASLSFFGDDLEPVELTKLLNGEPTYAVKKGDFHTIHETTHIGWRRPGHGGSARNMKQAISSIVRSRIF